MTLTKRDLALLRARAAQQQALEGPLMLRDYLCRYLAERDIRSKYRLQLGYTVDKLERWLGRPATLAELTDDLLDAWLGDIAAGGVSSATVRGQRCNLRSIWAAAHQAGLTEVGPGRSRKIRLVNHVVRQWSESDVERLLEAAATLKRFWAATGVYKAYFWRAFILTCWDSGCTPGDVLTLRRADVKDDGRIALRSWQRGFGIVAVIRPEAVEAIKASFPPERDDVFPWPYSRQKLWDEFRALIELAGVKGTSRMLRRPMAREVAL